mgnify:CR=1 FL=1
MIKKINLIFLTFFNIGKINYAPGSVASFVVCVLFYLSVNIINIWLLLLFTLIIFLYSFVAINNSYDQFKSEDPEEIVIDEVVGQLLPLIFIPVYETLYPLPKIYYCIAAFLLFRIFDIWKPYPIRNIDRNVEGALGIMLDDVYAGFYTILILVPMFFFLGG